MVVATVVEGVVVGAGGDVVAALVPGAAVVATVALVVPVPPSPQEAATASTSTATRRMDEP
jgi:hypothetical protein